MNLLLLETGVVILIVLAAMEMRRQRVPWRSVVIRSAVILAVLTAMVVAWRGL